MMLTNLNTALTVTAAPSRSDLFNLASNFDFSDLHFKLDKATGLHAIIAIHNTRFGPALGGCRFIPYTSTDEALLDAMRLARTMSYKAAIADLPLGGGKAVIMRPAHIDSREALFEAYGRFVDELGGRFITSVDSGTSTQDMDIVARHTAFVKSTSIEGDPSPYTALGVRHGIEAAVKFKLGRGDLEGIHIAIQGAGHVGYALAKELHSKGALLTMCDMNKAAVQRCVDEFGAVAVHPDKILKVKADVLAPCALGGVINRKTAPKLKVQIIAGATNNPLASVEQGVTLHSQGILYAPDYVINAGGLMQVWIKDEKALREKISSIHDALLHIFEEAAASDQSPALMVNRIAERILYGPELE